MTDSPSGWTPPQVSSTSQTSSGSATAQLPPTKLTKLDHDHELSEQTYVEPAIGSGTNVFIVPATEAGDSVPKSEQDDDANDRVEKAFASDSSSSTEEDEAEEFPFPMAPSLPSAAAAAETVAATEEHDDSNVSPIKIKNQIKNEKTNDVEELCTKSGTIGPEGPGETGARD